MDPQSDHIELDFKEFVEQPEYFIDKYPHQFLLLKEGKELNCVVLSAFLFDHITDKFNIDWSKK